MGIWSFDPNPQDQISMAEKVNKPTNSHTHKEIFKTLEAQIDMDPVSLILIFSEPKQETRQFAIITYEEKKNITSIGALIK